MDSERVKFRSTHVDNPPVAGRWSEQLSYMSNRMTVIIRCKATISPRTNLLWLEILQIPGQSFLHRRPSFPDNSAACFEKRRNKLCIAGRPSPLMHLDPIYIETWLTFVAEKTTVLVSDVQRRSALASA